MGQTCLASSKSLAKITVSSANWEILWLIPPALMPFIFLDSNISRVRASATTRKARGEKGHPCGTPQCI
eukprot:scaffold8445_cov145-Isochrysis_galbana.AAC.1